MTNLKTEDIHLHTLPPPPQRSEYIVCSRLKIHIKTLSYSGFILKESDKMNLLFHFHFELLDLDNFIRKIESGHLNKFKFQIRMIEFDNFLY